MNTVLQLLDAVAGAGARTDGQLLDSFARRRDQGAFAELVHRHGTMVLGVCRRVLGNAADADDAFQAVFLVLARKATAVRDRERLGPWLHGVAFNAARRLKRANLRRTARERGRAGQLEQTAGAADERAELHAALDEELARLPDRYRSVLCDLEGRTRKEAAHALGCPEGTVGGRLARARELLAARLGARGVCPALGALAGALVPVGAGAVAPALVAALVRAVGVDELARDAARGPISSHVSELAEGVVSSMFAIKLQKVTAAVLCCGLALACAAGGVRLAKAQPEPEFTPVPLLTEDPALKRSQQELEKRARELQDTRKRQQALEEAVPGVPRRAAIIPLRKLDSGEVAPMLAKFFDPRRVTIAALHGDKSLLVYADEKTHAKIRELLLQMGEPAPRNVTAFRLNKTADLAGTVKTLAAAFDPDRVVLVPVPVEQVLLVYASEPDTQTVQKLLAKVLLPESGMLDNVFMKTVRLKNILAEDASAEVRAQFGRSVLAVALPSSRQLMLHGPVDVVEAALKVVTALDEGGTAKTFEMQFQKAAWPDVLDWYAKVSGLVMSTTVKPTGTFTFAALKPGQRYTLADVTDIINEALMQQKLLLVPWHTTFFILKPSDEKLDSLILPLISLEDLPRFGRTELVQVIVPVPKGAAEELVPAVKKRLGPFGSVTTLHRADTLVVQDVAENVREVCKIFGVPTDPKR